MGKQKKTKAPQQQNVESSSTSRKLTEEEMEELKRVFRKAHNDIKEYLRKENKLDKIARMT